jgi:hypothetical protein
MKSLLDPSFRYTSSVDTNIRKTFARVRREQARATGKLVSVQNQPVPSIIPIKKRKSQ